MEKKKIRLYFQKPIDAEVNLNGGQFGAQRDKGRRQHKGLDFIDPLNKNKPVHASEAGIVVYSGIREGSTTRTNYGRTIVIDHTPDVPDNQRHIYTLYGHLDKRMAYKGKSVRKGENIGISGNSGTVAYYKKLNQSYHLHFEVIDSEGGFDWSMDWPVDLRPEHRKNPIGYLPPAKTIVEYQVPDLPGRQTGKETAVGFPHGWF